jgi:hypothetical protein
MAHYRLPDDTTTGNVNVYIEHWHAAAAFIEDQLDLHLVAYDPDLSLITNNKTHITLPVWFVTKLTSLLRTKNNEIERLRAVLEEIREGEPGETSNTWPCSTCEMRIKIAAKALRGEK